jgi:Na+/H+ antiporter NhaA
VQDFLRTSTAGATPMFAAAAVALVWVNSPWWQTYERLWATHVTIGVGRWAIHEDLRFWVGEGLMTSFFLLAGMEIKRELTSGELRHRRSAVMPVVAAAGGMVVPALLYVAATHGTSAVDGWGMAMPTDLAFALGILVLLVRTAPPGIRPFLLTLAIVDDLLTVVVVGVGYANGFAAAPAALGLASVGLMIVCERARVRHLSVYVVLGVLTWLFAYHAGLHPALVGAVLGLLTPAHPFRRTDAVSPLARIEHDLLPWVNLGVLPSFALANAGVRLSGLEWTSVTTAVVVGMVLARLVGKTVGVLGAAALVARARLGRLPAPGGWGAPAAAAAAAGAPFTVSLFVATSVFAEGSPLLAAARVGVLLSIVVCAAAAFALGRLPPRREPPEPA